MPAVRDSPEGTPDRPRTKATRRRIVWMRPRSPEICFSSHHLDRQPSLGELAATKLAEAAHYILKAMHRQRRQILGLELTRQFEPQLVVRRDATDRLFRMALVEADGQRFARA